MKQEIKKQIEVRRLSVVLTNEEVLEKSKELAKSQLDIKDTEAKAKDSAADYKAIIARFDATIAILSRAINNGYEDRDVECEWEFDYKEGVKTLIRKDTLATVRVEPISDYERQQNLPLDD